MKTLGLIGGVSWVSTVNYYYYINEQVNKELGGLNYAQCLLYSFNYNDIKKRNDAADFKGTTELIVDACNKLKSIGAEGIVLCANTMHMCAEEIEERVGLPLVHIAKATAIAIKEKQLTKVGLLGTKFTMEQNFFKEKLTAQGISTIIPNEGDRAFVHEVIFAELGKGYASPESKDRFLEIVLKLIEDGAEGIILGCTELPLVVMEDDVPVPIFDTTKIHAKAAVGFALGKDVVNWADD